MHKIIETAAQTGNSRCNGEIGSRQRTDFGHLLGFLQGNLLTGGLLFLLLVLRREGAGGEEGH